MDKDCQKNRQVSRRWIGMSVFTVALLAMAWGQGTSQARIGNGEIISFTSYNIKSIAKGRAKMTVLGNPIKGNLSTQRIQFEAKSLVGTIRQQQGGKLLIEEATFTGGVDLKISRDSQNKASKVAQTIEVQTERADFNGATNVITLPGRFELLQNDPGTDQRSSLEAPSGTVTVYGSPAPASARTTLKAMSINGPLIYKSSRPAEGEDGKPIPGKRTTINARADRLVYDDATGKMTLSGNVKIDGDDPGLFGDIVASRVVVTLNAKGEIEEIDVVGEPATTTVTRKPPGGNR